MNEAFESRLRLLAVLGAISSALFFSPMLLTGCSRSRDQYGGFGKSAVPVIVAVAVQQPVAQELHEIGTVEAFSTVSVKSKVEGELVGVHFHEGDEVHQGQLLFTIDPRPFKADLDHARANLDSDLAKLKQAEDDEHRWAYMLKEGVGSQAQYDQYHANAGALRAQVEADKAAVRTAELNLGYCTITSPIDGRTGNLQVHRGNLVKADSDTPLVTINQIEPIYVDFSAPEKDLAEIRSRMSEGTLHLTALIPGQQQPAAGVLSFVDNQVDKTTGTIALKGTFKNDDLRLWPGQFVNVALKLGEHPNAIIVPSQAVEVGQQGQYVYVVGNDLTVQMRTVVSGESIDGRTVIQRGLRAGERVVTDGQLRLMPGAKVKIKTGLGGTQEITS